MSDISLAILISFIFSIFIWIVDLYGSVEKSKLKSLLCVASLLYLGFLCIGNFAATLGAASLLNQLIDLQENQFFKNYLWFWYSFLGVFGFEGVIQHINLTFRDNAILKIRDWINKARDFAIEKIVEKNLDAEKDAIETLSLNLRKLDQTELDTRVINILGEDRLAELEEIVRQNPNVDPKLIKAHALANDAFIESSSIIRSKKRK